MPKKPPSEVKRFLLEVPKAIPLLLKRRKAWSVALSLPEEVVAQFMVQEALYEVPTAKGGRMEEDEGLTLSENDASLHSLAVGIQI